MPRMGFNRRQLRERRFFYFRQIRIFVSFAIFCLGSSPVSVLIRDIRVIRGSQRFCAFPRNARPNPTEYIGERPEMTSPRHAGARECGTKVARWEAKEGQNNESK